jgi:Zn-dependent peptidase ImmA (M78 family)
MQSSDENRFKMIQEKAVTLIKSANIKTPPVILRGIFKIIEDKFNVAFQFEKKPLSSGYSGQVIDLGRVVGIIYNSKDSVGRQRFTISHELGHYILDHLKSHKIKLEAIKIKTKNPIEREANIFAANLLMPDFLMKKKKVNSKDDIVKLAEKYQVTYEAMNYKVCSSNYLSGIALDKTDYFQRRYKEKEDSPNIEENLRPIEDNSYDDLTRRIYSKDE